MKKTLGILLVLCLLMSCLTATVAAADDTVTLAWWYRGNGEQADTELVNAKINEMLKSYPGLENVALELHCQPAADYSTQVMLALASEEKMDILNTVSLNPYQLVSDGTLMPLDDLIALTPALIEELPEQMINYGRIGDTLYFICHQQQAANGMNLDIPTRFIENGWIDGDKMYDYLNMDNFGKYDYKEFWAYTEECLKAIREGSGEDNFYLDPIEPQGGTSNCSQFIGYFDSVSGYSSVACLAVDAATHTVQFWDTIDAAADVFEQDAKWYDAGLLYFDNTVEVLAPTKPQYPDTTEPRAIYYESNGTGSTEYLNEIAPTMYAEPLTRYQLSRYYAPLAYAAGGDGIPYCSENPELAMKVIECMNTVAGKEIYNTVVYGIEGTHWEFVDKDNDVIKTYGYDGPQGGSDYLYSAHKWIMGNTMNAYLNQACTPYTRQVINDVNYGEGTIFSELTGIVFDPAEVEAQVDQIKALYTEYHDTLKFGIKGEAGWREYYDEYVEKVNLAGLDDVIACFQAQVDAFLAK